MRNSKISIQTYRNFTKVIFKMCVFHCCWCGRLYFSKMDRLDFPFPRVLLEPATLIARWSLFSFLLKLRGTLWLPRPNEHHKVTRILSLPVSVCLFLSQLNHGSQPHCWENAQATKGDCISLFVKYVKYNA